MKRISVLFLALLLIACVLPVSALTSVGTHGEVPLVKGEIVLDGKKDAVYDQGLQLSAGGYNDATKAEQSTNTAYFLHDGKYLYICVVAHSVYPLTDYNPSYAGGPAWQTTGVELLFDFSNAAKAQADGYKIKSWYDGQIFYALKSLEGHIELKATVDKAKQDFTMEYKVELIDGAGTGKEIGFNMMVDFDKTMGPANKPTNVRMAINSVYDDASKQKNLVLSDKTVTVPSAAAAATKAAATAASTAKTAAPKTADASAVIAATLIAASAAVIVLKNRKH